MSNFFVRWLCVFVLLLAVTSVVVGAMFLLPYLMGASFGMPVVITIILLITSALIATEY